MDTCQMKKSLNNQKTKIRFVKIFILIFVSLCVLVVIRYFPYSWSQYVNYGAITGKILSYKNNLVYGSSYSRINILNTKKTIKHRSLDLNHGDVLPQFILKDSLVVISGDTISRINLKRTATIWNFSTGDHDYFKKAYIYKDIVFAGANSGALYAINYKNGKLIWRFDVAKISKLSSVIFNNDYYYFGDFAFDNGTVYLASRDGFFYALKITDGSLIWKTEIGDAPTTGPIYNGGQFIVTTINGNTLALNQKDGKIIWQNQYISGTVCSLLEERINFRNSYLSEKFSRFITKLGIKNTFLLEFHGDGTLLKRNTKTGKEVWKSDVLGAGYNCPSYGEDQAIITSMSGNVVAISLKNGYVKWKVPNLGIISAPAERVFIPKLGLAPFYSSNSSSYIFGNHNGEVFAVSGKDGKIIWKFETGAPVASKPVVNGNEVYITSVDGVFNKIYLRTGQPPVSINDRFFKVTQSSDIIGGVSIHEISLRSSGKFTTPWREAEIFAYLVDESGRKIYIPGFYYDDNVWKIRFNPPSKGIWRWELTWRPHGAMFIKNGTLESSSDTSNFYIRVDNKDPSRLTLDGSTIFNGLGIGETLIDYNYSGSPLDDWAIGDISLYTQQDYAGSVDKIGSDGVYSLNEYISTYGPNGGGFNIFRWSLLNFSDSQYRQLEFPTAYSIHNGMVGDDLVKSLRENGVHIWLTMFGFDIPFKYSSDTGQRFLLGSYIRYLFARYGAYVDVWELGNEVALPDSLEDFMIRWIRHLDFEGRPISISSESSGFDKSNILAPHWYETENYWQSDIRTVQQISKYSQYKKPIVFAEQGNRYSNYDYTSALRMRIRSWTAFFNSVTLIFWNSSRTRDYLPLLPSGNLFIGEEERSYTRVLQEFTKQFPLDSIKTTFLTNNDGIRNYGLESEKIIAGYFYHFSDPFTETSFVFNFSPKINGTIRWINTETGEVIQQNYCSAGYCQVRSPLFKSDIAMKFE